MQRHACARITIHLGIAPESLCNVVIVVGQNAGKGIQKRAASAAR